MTKSTEKGFSLDEVRGKRPPSQKIRVATRSGGKRGGGGGSSRAARNAMRTSALAGTPQAIVKITGFGKGHAAHVKAHIDYITRHGKEAAKDQGGERHAGKGTGAGIVREWGDSVKTEGKTPKARERERLTMHLAISAPPGTDRATFEKIANDFGERAFEGRRYVYAIHDDKDHPHAHFVVPLRGDDGRKLNPRKEDLQRWREQYAEAAVKRGVQMAATRWYEHRKDRPPLDRSSTVTHRMLARGQVSEKLKADMRSAMTPAPEKMLAAAERIAKRAGVEMPADVRTNVVAARAFLEQHSKKTRGGVLQESATRHRSQAEELRVAGKAALAGLHDKAARMEPVGRVEALRGEIGRVGSGKGAVSPKMAALAASIAKERGLELPDGDFKAVRSFLNQNAEREIPLREKEGSKKGLDFER
jgi:hypothetical protein